MNDFPCCTAATTGWICGIGDPIEVIIATLHRYRCCRALVPVRFCSYKLLVTAVVSDLFFTTSWNLLFLR